jgi:hypothetical protein
MLDITFLARDLVFFLLIAPGMILLACRLAMPCTLGLVVVGMFLSPSYSLRAHGRSVCCHYARTGEPSFYSQDRECFCLVQCG